MSLDSGKATLSEVYRMGVLILIRHGQSVWNAENRFTGWTDVELSERGVGEAERAGDLLSEIRFGVVHTRYLLTIICYKI